MGLEASSLVVPVQAVSSAPALSALHWLMHWARSLLHFWLRSASKPAWAMHTEKVLVHDSPRRATALWGACDMARSRPVQAIRSWSLLVVVWHWPMHWARLASQAALRSASTPAWALQTEKLLVHESAAGAAWAT